jgi:cellulose synthase/poly-beta-1,6-N-acetylglucosamine synthase-like glycosyltransferase
MLMCRHVRQQTSFKITLSRLLFDPRWESARLATGDRRPAILGARLHQTLILAAYLANQKGLVSFLKRQFLDQTFRGLYHPNTFDTLLLVPYFFVLIVLASYGIHRYVLVYLYYKNRKNRSESNRPLRFFAPDELPTVTLQLPIFNEQFVVERLIESACRLDYPREKLQIQLLDDSTDETAEVARDMVERYAALGNPITYIHRTNRQGFKAGALDNGMKYSNSELIAIFDADFVIPEDWLLKVVHQFTDSKVGMVQTRWTHLNRDYSFLTEVEAILLDGHFVLEHGGRSRAQVFFNFNGTAGMWRRKAIEEAGGWEHDTLTEDTDLSYRAQLKGWKFKYLQDVECPAELPIEMTAFKTQQARWAKGLVQVGKKILPTIFKSDIPWHQKVEAWFHLTANISYPFMIVLSALLLPAMVIRSFGGWFQMLLIDLPLFIASTFSISSFYLVSQKELFPTKWYRTFLYLPFLMSLGIGLTITNSKAVWEAIVGKQTAFARTPKYSVQQKGERSKAAPKYRKRLGIIPWIELAIGSWFVYMVWYAMNSMNYITVPFMCLFVLGFYYTGLMSLLQGRFDKNVAASSSSENPKPVPVGV